MKLKLTVGRDPKHSGMASGVGWATSEEVFSCADDHQLLRWNLISGETTTLATLPESMFPTDIHWYVSGHTTTTVGAIAEGAEATQVSALSGRERS